MATQNAGTAPTSCEQLSVGPPLPFFTTLPQAPPGLTNLDGFIGYVACLYRPVPYDGLPASGVVVAWFSSASQAEQAYTAIAAAVP